MRSFDYPLLISAPFYEYLKLLSYTERKGVETRIQESSSGPLAARSRTNRLCHPVPSCAILCHPVPSCAILCHPMSSYAILCHPVPSCAILANEARSTELAVTSLISNKREWNNCFINLKNNKFRTLRHWEI